jgi:hypothetical protein
MSRRFQSTGNGTSAGAIGLVIAVVATVNKPYSSGWWLPHLETTSADHITISLVYNDEGMYSPSIMHFSWCWLVICLRWYRIVSIHYACTEYIKCLSDEISQFVGVTIYHGLFNHLHVIDNSNHRCSGAFNSVQIKNIDHETKRNSYPEKYFITMLLFIMMANFLMMLPWIFAIRTFQTVIITMS